MDEGMASKPDGSRDYCIDRVSFRCGAVYLVILPALSPLPAPRLGPATLLAIFTPVPS